MSSVTVGMYRLSAVGVSELVWKQVPDSGSGDWECPTAKCATSMDGVVRSASNDVRNVVADDWRCLRLERSSRPDTAALLLWRHRWTVTPSLYRTRSAALRQCKSACEICDSPRSYLRVPPTRRAAAFSTCYSFLLVTDLGELASTTLQ